MKSEVLMSKEYGWRQSYFLTSGGQRIDVWFKGYLRGGELIQDHLSLIQASTDQDPPSFAELNKWIQSLDGHYAIVLDAGLWAFSACDRIRSIPLLYYQSGNLCTISNRLDTIKEKYSLARFGDNENAAIEIGTSGYTIGRKSLYRKLYQLTAAECILVHGGGIERQTYFSYTKPRDLAAKRNQNQLSEVLSQSFQDISVSSSNRQFIVPLSAGYDSRLIASGLKKVGINKVLCFSYGHKDSFEVKTGKQVAAGLGYDWIHIDLDRKYSKNVFRSDVFKKYYRFADIACGTPYVREFAAVNRLLLEHKHLIESDAIFINGNTGDFISGGHIAEQLLTDRIRDPFEVAIDYTIQKHYSLWDMTSLETHKKIKRTLQIHAKKLKEHTDLDCEPPEPYEIYELLEWYGRQAKLIVSMQRIYEFFGYEWRMPLWDNAVIDFWLNASFSQKYQKKLYIDTLIKNNWGGVWQTTGVNKITVRPIWMSFVRFIFKIVFLLSGLKDKWKRFERTKLYYWIDPYHYNYPVSYRKVFFDTLGHRSHLSWWVGCYLGKYGFVVKNIVKNK